MKEFICLSCGSILEEDKCIECGNAKVIELKESVDLANAYLDYLWRKENNLEGEDV